MDKHDAAKVLYGYVPQPMTALAPAMDILQDLWNQPGVKDTWRDNAAHAAWWILHALVHDTLKSVEPGKAYLELTKRG